MEVQEVENSSTQVSNFAPSADPVKIDIVSSDGFRQTIDGTFQQFTSRWLFLNVSERIPPLMVVSVERDDVLLTGEVLACTRNEDGSWRLRIQVAHKLTNLRSLMRLRGSLLGEQVPSLAPIPGRLS